MEVYGTNCDFSYCVMCIGTLGAAITYCIYTIHTYTIVLIRLFNVSIPISSPE